MKVKAYEAKILSSNPAFGYQQIGGKRINAEAIV
jgi:hypothetical protein